MSCEIEIGSKILANIDGTIEKCQIFELSPSEKFLRVGIKKGRVGWGSWIRVLDILEVFPDED